ncbi:MAG: NAD(P)H-binding protein [Bryobacteraceae bacterium]
MKAILFGATGMVGQAVLRECLLDADVESVLSIGRGTTGQTYRKLRELVHRDFLDFSAIENSLAGFDACFFCLGVSSAGMKEADYRRVTYDFTLAAAQALAGRNPGMTFVYVSGAGTDSSEKGRTMWARVKGETENALLRLPFKAAYMFRPAVIVPRDGIRSKTRVYQLFYTILGPLLPVLNAIMPQYVTTTEKLGRAMIQVARRGWAKPVLENPDINAIADGIPG